MDGPRLRRLVDLSSGAPAAVETNQKTRNLAKYESASGIERRLLGRFRERLVDEIRAAAPATILDAGCGEGVVTGWIDRALPSAAVTAVDGDPRAVAECARRNDSVDARVADVYDLPLADASFDLVVATEVLEHMDHPGAALRELARVSAGALLLTVPREPFFRLGNLARGRYVRRLGSTPGHVNTWGRRSFLVQLEGEARALRWRGAFPWQLVVATTAVPLSPSPFSASRRRRARLSRGRRTPLPR